MSALWRRNCLDNVEVTGLALHALEPDEEIEVVEHLAGCVSCQEEFRDTERMLAGLGASIEQVDPPASLRGAILGEATRTAQDPSTEPPPSGLEDPAEASPVDTPTVARVIPRRRRGRPPGSPMPASRPGLTRRSRLVAASLVLAGLLGFGGLAAYSAQLAAQRDVQSAQAQALAEIITGLGRPGARHATLTRPDGTALATVVVLDGRRTLVTSGDLAPNSIDRDTYVVWGIGTAGPRAIDTFDVSAAGPAVHSVGSEVVADGFSSYAISIEPGRVAPPVPSTVVAVGRLQA